MIVDVRNKDQRAQAFAMIPYLNGRRRKWVVSGCFPDKPGRWGFGYVDVWPVGKSGNPFYDWQPVRHHGFTMWKPRKVDRAHATPTT